MSDMNTETIYAVANFFDLAPPPAVTDAEATYDAAVALRDNIAAETAPDLSAVTAKNLRKTHEAAVAWETRDVRLRAAVAIVTVAQERLDSAKFTSAHALRQPLAELFNQRAGEFMTALEAMGGTTALTPGNGEAFSRLGAAAQDLDMLRRARDAYALTGSRASTIHDPFEKLSRVFRLALNPHSDHLNFAHNTTDVEFWAGGVNRGHTITWQETTAQEQNSDDYIQSRRSQQAPAGARLTRTAPLARFMSKVDLSNPEGCWVWMHRVDTGGYGKFKFLGKDVIAHRWAFEHIGGNTPTPGLVLDHTCGQKLCVAPLHLEEVTQRENIRRSVRRRSLARSALWTTPTTPSAGGTVTGGRSGGNERADVVDASPHVGATSPTPRRSDPT